MKSDIGNKEWLNDYGQLKKVNPNNPFTVPDGYFNELSGRIVSGIRLNDLKQKEQQGFSVPENYFDDLSGNIMSRINIVQTLNQQTGFTVPDNYFEQLNVQIHSRIVIDEALANTTEALTVPANYFDRLNKNILNQTVNLDMVKRKGFIRQLYNAPAFKYATAACFVAIVGAGLFFRPTSDSNAHKSSYLHKQLSGVSDQEMQNYLRLYADGNEAQHIINAEGLTVNDTRLQSDLNDFVDSQ